MKTLLAALLATALVAVAAPVNGAADYSNENVAYLMNVLGMEEIPDEVITVNMNGVAVEMTAAEAFAEAGKASARWSLADAAEVATGGVAGVGDMSFLAFGCSLTGSTPQPAGTVVTPTDQFWLYGGVIDLSGTCGVILTTEWTTKQVQRNDGYGGATLQGIGSWFSFFGLTIGSMDGVVVTG